MKSEKKSTYDQQYIRDNIVQVRLTLNRRTESGMIKWLDQQPNRQGYLKALIREDMEKKGDFTMTTWNKFNALDFSLRDGVIDFWEPGYDYSDPDFWSSYENPDPAFIKAVQMYDYLKKTDPDGE